jgi:hypothetical protein
MRKRAERSPNEQQQYVLIARWLDYMTCRFSRPGRIQRARRGVPSNGNTDVEEATAEEIVSYPELLPLVKETLFEKWFWVGVCVVANIVLAIVNAVSGF